MSLIKCRECGKEISDLAENCIHCGCSTLPPKRKKSKLTLLYIIPSIMTMFLPFVYYEVIIYAIIAVFSLFLLIFLITIWKDKKNSPYKNSIIRLIIVSVCSFLFFSSILIVNWNDVFDFTFFERINNN